MSSKKTCLVCGDEFSPTDARVVTCGRSCGARLGHQRADRPALVLPRDQRSNLTKKQHANRRKRDWPKLEDRDWLRKKYEDGCTQQEIADLIGCSRCAVSGALKRHGIKRRSKSDAQYLGAEKRRGEKAWNWKGGVWNGKPLGPGGGLYSRWKLRKQKVEERGHVCEGCGDTEKKLHLHHLIPFFFSRSNDDDNLLLLCTTCHGKMEALFREMAGAYFVSAGCLGFLDAAMILKSELRTDTSSKAS